MLTTLHTFWVWVTSTLVGKIVASGFISMLPLVELRAGIPIAVGLGLEPRIAILYRCQHHPHPLYHPVHPKNFRRGAQVERHL